MRSLSNLTFWSSVQNSSKNNGKTDRESFLSQFHEYISMLERDKISRSEVLGYVKNPFGVDCASKHRQIYLNLHSMLFSDAMTAMAASNCFGFHLDDLRTAQAECINNLESFQSINYVNPGKGF